MGLVAIKDKHVASVKPVENVLTMEAGFTTKGYYQWVTSAYRDNALLCKNSIWWGGMSVRMSSGDSYTLGVDGKPFNSVLQKERHSVEQSNYYMVVPLSDGEYSSLEKNKTVTASYPQVLFGCLWDSVHINMYDSKEKDYGNLSYLISTYMRDAGCRATKYAICVVEGSRLFSPSYLVKELCAFNNLLLSKGGARMFGITEGAELRKELTQYNVVMKFILGCRRNLLANVFAASLASIQGTGKFTITPKMLKSAVNCVDVSKGTIVPCNITL